MFISLAASSFINALGLFCASKIMNMALSLVQAFIAATLAALVTLLFPQQSLLAFALVFAVYIVALKIFTSESVLGVVKLAVVGMIITVVIVKTGLLALLGITAAVVSN